MLSSAPSVFAIVTAAAAAAAATAASVIVHLLRVAQPAKPWSIYNAWSERICDEFYAQGDEERKLGLPVAKPNDREAPLPMVRMLLLTFLYQHTHWFVRACTCVVAAGEDASRVHPRASVAAVPDVCQAADKRGRGAVPCHAA